MQCKQCGTEIAEKAIVCYRCGAATTDPVRRPAAIRPRRGRLPSTLAAVFLLIVALYMGQASRTAANPDEWRMLGAALAAAAVILLIFRIIRRR